ncbi:MAG: hypothetical protein IJG38_05100 [Thermoguttaceae bacterium]|nr:hypothetical protein [Thermoguttaceae bacterium]
MIPFTVFVLIALLLLAESRNEQLQGDLLEEKNRDLSQIAAKQKVIINKYEQLLKERKNNDNN